MFDRLELLVGNSTINKLKKTHVVVLGLGGVGGYVLESLVRSGIGEVTIIDNDTVDITNINRQIIAKSNNIGSYKTLEFEKRIKEIRSDIKVNVITEYIDESNLDIIFSKDIDYLVDACDSFKTKCLIIKKCLDLDIRFITCTGTGNKMNPSKLQISDIRKSVNDPLAKKIRKYIKDNNIKGKVPCVYSTEVPLRKGSVIGSNSFVPCSAGLLITSYIINNIWEECKDEDIKM